MKTLEQLIQGYEQFRTQYCPSHRDLLAQLARGQQPQVMLITCADSRIEPALIFQADPGDLFVLRNAGNLVPPFSDHASAEAGTIEFAVLGLKVRHIVVMGHTQCGAVRAMLQLDSLRSQLPWLCRCLEPSLRVSALAQTHARSLSDEERLHWAVRFNVLVQLDNLLTHPAVVAAVARCELALHGWLYSIETGEIYAYRQDTAQFAPLQDTGGQPISSHWPVRLTPS